jgi:hypothetical protein
VPGQTLPVSGLGNDVSGSVLICGVWFNVSGVSNQAISKIDEMFFEYHVQDKYMGTVWSNGHELPSGSDMQTAFELFSKLRHKGLRIHSWV